MMHSIIHEISTIIISLDFLQHENGIYNQNINIVIDSFPQDVKDILLCNYNLSEKRRMMYRHLLKMIKIYKDNLKNVEKVSKNESFSLFVIIDKIYRYNFNETIDLKKRIISEINHLYK